MDNPKYSDALIQETIELFQHCFTTPIDRKDAEELISRAAGFIRVMNDFLPAILEHKEMEE